MKFVLILTSIISTCAIGQEKHEICLPDSTSKTIILENNPSKLPDRELTVSPLTFSRIANANNGDPLMGIRLEPLIRFKNGIYLNTPIMLSYGHLKKHNPYKRFYYNVTRAKEVNVLGHIPLKRKEKTKYKKTWVDFKAEEETNTMIQINNKLPRKSRSTIYVDFGLGILNSRKKTNLYRRTINEPRYSSSLMTAFPLYIGASRLKSKSYGIIDGNNSRKYLRTNQFYCHLSLSLLNYSETRFSTNMEGIKLNTEYDLEIKSAPLGWRVGYYSNPGIENSLNSFSFGFEIGHFNLFNISSTEEKSSSNLEVDFQIRIGYTFRSNSFIQI